MPKKQFSILSVKNLHSQDAQAISWMVINCFWFAIMTAMIRYISAEIHPFMIVFFRQIGALLIMTPWFFKQKMEVFTTERHKGIHFARALAGLAAMELWYYSISILPMPDAVALSFTTPLLTLVAAVLFLKEKVNYRKWIGLFTGLLGTLIILRPGTGVFQPEALLVVLTALCWAASNTLIKFLSQKDTPQTIVFYMTLFMLPLSLPFALMEWQTPTFIQLLWLLGIGAISHISFICLSTAIAKADISVVLPFDFTKLVFVSIIAYAIFDEIVDIWIITGSMVIIASAVYASRKIKEKLKSPAMEL